MDDGKPEWDEGRATALIGALVLVGITYEAADGEHHEQFFGTVETANKDGISLRLGGSREGETYNLPPDLSAFFPAQPGDYCLRATGEILTDPDYTSTWNICARND